MSNQKFSTLLTLSLLSTSSAAFPAASASTPQSAPFYNHARTVEAASSSQRASLRKMRHQLISTPVLSRPNESSTVPGPEATLEQSQEPEYLHPPLANHIDAPLPEITTSDQVVGIYSNILYPQDNEQLQQKKLLDWIEAYAKDPSAPFPLALEEFNSLSLYILERFPLRAVHWYFADQVRKVLEAGQSLEDAVENAKKSALARTSLYKEIAQNIPAWGGRCEILIEKLIECTNKMQSIVKRDAKTIRENPNQIFKTQQGFDLIEHPLTWDVRADVFRQMIDKVTSVSPNSPYFLALQEVTPQALSDLKKTFADRHLQWISFNNISGKTTLEPGQEEVLGEAVGFTSTMALSSDLEVLKVELSDDLPTESGSVRKVLAVRVRNIHTNEILNLFTAHTDHVIQNDIYARTAAKIHEFATQFLQDAAPHQQRFVLGGDLNAFEWGIDRKDINSQLTGAEYIKRLRELFTQSQDFRETDYYAPSPIAWSSFIGRYNDAYSAGIRDGVVEHNALDHIIVGNGIELQSAARIAGVYNQAGRLLDYYKERDEYMRHLQERVTFSDHFMSVVRFK